MKNINRILIVFISIFLVGNINAQYSKGLVPPTEYQEAEIQKQFKHFYGYGYNLMVKSMLKAEDVNRISNYDLRDEGGITPIKNQQSCGSCWAFSAIASYESSFALRNNQKNRRI